METKINVSLAICFAVFVIGLVSVGADLLSAIAASLLFAPLLVVFFTGPAVLFASLMCCFEKPAKEPVEPIQWDERMD
jgi:hypothetical protein